MLGGVSWFAIPWVFGTVMGLAGRALITDPNFPTYPYALSPSQVSAGLVAPAAAVTVLGAGGAIAVLLVVFMAATSAASAQLIAVSSLLTFDVCGLWKPLRGKQAVTASHIAIMGFAVWSGAWATILFKAEIDLGWLYYVQGVVLTPAVFPIAATIVWKKQSRNAAFYGTIIGVACGMAGWMSELRSLVS
jgi:Na+/proline symporter